MRPWRDARGRGLPSDDLIVIDVGLGRCGRAGTEETISGQPVGERNIPRDDGRVGGAVDRLAVLAGTVRYLA